MDKSTIKKIYFRILKEKSKDGKLPTISDMILAGVKKHELTELGGITAIEKEYMAMYPQYFPKDHEIGSRRQVRKEDVLLRYVKFRQDMGKVPTRSDFLRPDVDITRHEIEAHFGTINNCEEQARLMFPEYFKDVPIAHIHVESNMKRISEITSCKSLFVTSAVSGHEVNDDFYSLIKQWEKQCKGKLVIMLSADPASMKSTVGDLVLDSILTKELIVTENIRINDYLYLSKIMIQAKQQDPTHGMDDVAQAHGSSIFGSPKQRIKPVSVEDPYKGRNLITPGALTNPGYESKFVVSGRTAEKAEVGHIMGGIIIDIDPITGTCFPRPVMFNSTDKSFVDMGIKYSLGKEPKKIKTLGMVPGDWHSGATSESAKKAFIDMCNYFKPDKIVPHDLYNGLYVSPFIVKDEVESVKVYKHLGGFMEELEIYSNEVKFLSERCNELIIPKCNHDEWLDLFIRKGWYRKERSTIESGMQLHQAMIQGRDPLRTSFEDLLKNGNDHNITWLRYKDSYKIGSTTINFHGHKGPRGKKNPTLAAFQTALKDFILGHSHHTEVSGFAYRVGTFTELFEPYSEGSPSDWSNSVAVIYEDHSKQMFFIFKGEWRAKLD